MGELEHGITLSQFLDQSIDAEVVLTLRSVVQQHHASVRHLGKPGVEVVLYCLEGVISVDMQEVDLTFSEVIDRIIEVLS